MVGQLYSLDIENILSKLWPDEGLTRSLTKSGLSVNVLFYFSTSTDAVISPGQQ
jgi:hypothetical protein